MATRSRQISTGFLFLKAMALFVFWVLLSASFEWIHLGLGLLFSFSVAWINSGHSPFCSEIWFVAENSPLSSMAFL